MSSPYFNNCMRTCLKQKQWLLLRRFCLSPEDCTCVSRLLVCCLNCRYNYVNPIYGVAMICHQVRCLCWGHSSLFHTATSLLTLNVPVPYKYGTHHAVPRAWAALPARFPFASRALEPRFRGVHATRIPTQNPSVRLLLWRICGMINSLWRRFWFHSWVKKWYWP